MFKSKKINIIVALVISVILWMYVMGDTDPLVPKKFEGIPIQFINMESLTSNGLAVENVETETIDIVVEGKTSIINNVSEEDFRVIADLYGRHNGKNYISLDIHTPRGVKVSEKSREKILVDIGTLVSATRNVQLDVKGEMPEDTTIDKTKIEPETVTIYGAKKNVDRVSSVRGSVDAKDLSDNIGAFKIDLQPKNKNGKLVDYVKVSHEEATAYVRLIHVKTIPLEVETKGEVDDGVELDTVVAPETVSIEGEAASLKEIEKLQCEPIDITGLTKTTDFDLKFTLPDGVKIAGDSDKLVATVKVKGPGEQKVKIEPDKIQINNLDPDLNAKIETAVSITVKAKEKISADDFELSVDASGLVAGTYNRALSCTCDKKIVSFKLNPSSVKLDLKEQE